MQGIFGSGGDPLRQDTNNAAAALFKNSFCLHFASLIDVHSKRPGHAAAAGLGAFTVFSRYYLRCLAFSPTRPQFA